MNKKLTLDIFQKAVERFESAEASVIQAWNSACNCPQPGELAQCWDCPYYKNLGILTQRKLHDNPNEVFAEIPPPDISNIDGDEVQQKCLEMYAFGYCIEDIQKLVGVSNRRVLRDWLRKGGLSKRSAHYPEEVKQKCLQMYEERYTVQQIENETGVTADTISDWVFQCNLSRKVKYPEKTKKSCLELYQSGHTCKEIHEQMDVPLVTIKAWVNQANLGRGKEPYSQAEIDACIKLYKEGKTPNEIQKMKGILAGWN